MVLCHSRREKKRTRCSWNGCERQKHGADSLYCAQHLPKTQKERRAANRQKANEHKGKNEHKGRNRPNQLVIDNLPESYRILGLQPGASVKEVKRAHRRLALAYHPDKNLSIDTTEQMCQLNNARDVIMNAITNTQGEVASKSSS